MYYNRFRYYDPNIGNYISKDPIGLNGNNPTLYGYVQDTNGWLDIFGLTPEPTPEPPSKQQTRLRHYTSRSGLNAIQADGKIIAYDQNRVFAEKAKGKPLSATGAAERYGIDRGSARDYVEFDVDSDRVEIVRNPITKATEYTVRGDIDLKKDAKFVKRH